MLTWLHIRNFKQFEDVEIKLGQSVVLIGPNNSGKTTALQALALWKFGHSALQSTLETLSEVVPDATNDANSSITDLAQPFVTVNRLDLTETPVPTTSLLWRNQQADRKLSLPIQLSLRGETRGIDWDYQLQLRYENDESVECAFVGGRPHPKRFDNLVPRFAFLSAMSGLAAVEDRLERGSIQRRIGEGRTAEVLRNLCLLLYEANGNLGYWDRLVTQMREQFGVELLPPQYIAGRGEIRMAYKDRRGIFFDLSAAGRGMLQVLLLLAYMYNNPGAVLLLDEPDAHLEILRQRQIYQLLTQVAQEQGGQIIIATHSEVILDTAAAQNDTIIGFIGNPHPVRRISELRKSLDLIRTEDYYLAEQAGWVLYVEGATDVPMLKAFAERLNHPVYPYMQQIFSKDIDGNDLNKALIHFNGLREAHPSLNGIVVLDRMNPSQMQNIPPGLQTLRWQRREIENYLFSLETLTAYARANGSGDSAEERAAAMRTIFEESIPPFALRNPDDAWWRDTKVSDENVMGRIFREYANRSNTPLLRKSNYFMLAHYIPDDQLDPEIAEKLDAILAVAK